MFADLHLHSRYSDGTYAPEEIVLRAGQFGLAALSLTDHDTVEGCPEAAAACLAKGLEFIPGVELTAELRGHELHLLAYYIDIHHEPLIKALAQYQVARQNRIREMVSRLNRLGVPLVAETVFNLAKCRSPGRPHVGRALVHCGYCYDLDEAFELFLKKNRPAWVPKYRVSATDLIQLIHGAGGLVVMAHPGLNHYDEAIPELVEAGLDGLECFHTKHTPDLVEFYLKTATEFRLLITGGSDCHGLGKGSPAMGSVRLPLAYLEPLRAWVAKRGYRQRLAPQTVVLPLNQAAGFAPNPAPMLKHSN